MTIRTLRAWRSALLIFTVATLPLTTMACDGDDGATDAIDSSAPDTTDDDTTDDDTGIPDTTDDDTGVPDTTDDDTGVPDTTDDDTGIPDTTDDDTGIPDTTDDDTGIPDTAPQDTGPDPGATPVVGDLMFTELMVNPDSVSDVVGEWLEVTTLAATDLDLRDCTLTYNDGTPVPLASEAGPMPVDARWVFGLSDDLDFNGGIVVDATYAGFLMSNSVGTLTLSCGETLFDQVSWDASTWVILPGVSQQFSSSADQLPSNNDDPAYWCEGDQSFGDGDLGSPGSANPNCPQRDEVVDFCQLVAPAGGTILEDGKLLLQADLYDQGFTDQSSGIDPIYFLKAEAGYGADGSDPSGDTWAWQTATPIVGWDDSNSSAGYDRYESELSGLSIARWDLAFRFSFDRGTTWTYCDLSGDDAYSISDAGDLDVADSPCVPNPCSTPPVPQCDGDEIVAGAEVGTCAVQAMAAQCTYEELRTDCTLRGGFCAAGVCDGLAVPPLPGQVVFTEILKDSNAVTDALGEWVELKNVSDHSVELSGCTLSDNGADMHSINGLQPLIVVAGETFILARNADSAVNGGVSAVYEYGAEMNLGNGSDSVTLSCAGDEIDTVTYTTSQFPTGPGKSMQLDVQLSSAADNDDGDNWCAAAFYFSGNDSGDLGSPGDDNHPCPQTADLCRLMTDETIAAVTEASVSVAGQLQHPGVTDVSAGNDPAPYVRASAGWGPTTASVTGSDFTWFDATPDDTWTDSAISSDQWRADVVAPVDAGDYKLAFRFSVDAGVSWTYCDRPTGTLGEDGSENGFQNDNATVLQVTTATACNPNPCTVPPADTCDGEVLNVFPFIGQCTLSGATLEVADCAYAPVLSDCAALGGSCAAGVCIDTASMPTSGEVVITEVMNRPSNTSDFFGEWFELTYMGSETANLYGCIISDDDFDAHIIDSPTGAWLLQPGDTVVFARNGDSTTNGGINVDYVYNQDIVLGNTLDELSLVCGETVIDRIVWGDVLSAAFPDTLGSAKQLQPGNDAAGNDDGSAWCDATVPYGDGDLGTPGSANSICQ